MVVLGGGTGRRLGGVSKPEVVARGARLLDHLLMGLESLKTPGWLGTNFLLGRICVVAPKSVALPDGVLRALEEPPLGGPVAGLAAGLQALGKQVGGAAPWTALLTCDAPGAWRLLPGLLPRLADSVGSGRQAGDGVCPLVADRPQYLLGIYRTASLQDTVAPGGVPLRDVPVKSTFASLRVHEIDLDEASAAAAVDLDTWAEIHQWDRHP
ncbi:molybdopterin-guanine dinucleotide biosynthesis protein MobA [Actinomyces bovis]|uniref:Molybdopterin-guanine dinucleotide biosynthesis protein MobA n=1 Tax=Actinomyces bovis TaxID=1658 RepID=A0ABY1VNW0_9ACTO|nr:molybdopterin-guanine dinucleotide biosynthesis protein MobA [Actinomyces bovis]VEG52736.1 molybdopterin-guanine dinucleotide biosynthesis protein MobA [Actinomyces israelii]